MTYLFLDESGDLGFSFDRGSSKYFVITILASREKRQLEKLAKDIHASFRGKGKRLNSLHAYRDNASVRRRLLRRVGLMDVRVFCLIVEKRLLPHAMHDDSVRIYRDAIKDILALVSVVDEYTCEPIILYASERETNKRHRFLLEAAIAMTGVGVVLLLERPEKEKALQVVDYVSWAVFRRYEYGDDEYYRLIEFRIVGKFFWP